MIKSQNIVKAREHVYLNPAVTEDISEVNHKFQKIMFSLYV